MPIESQPVSAVGEKFKEQITALREFAEQEAAAIQNQKPSKWYRPADFTAELTDLDAFHEPFSREEQEEWFRQACQDPQSPGTVADLTQVQLQGDLLAGLERAFRARHHSAARTRTQPSGRLAGHGLPDIGVLEGGLHGYVVALDKLNKGETA